MDGVEGGFFRYSTTRDWTLPHYEKLLSDNSALLSVVLRAYKTLGLPALRDAALKTADYMMNTLSDGESRFYGSQDADEVYYNALPEERARMEKPAVDRTVYTDSAAEAAIVFMQSGGILKRPDMIELGARALDFLWRESYGQEGGMAHYNDGFPHRFGLLDDQVAMADASLKAYGLTGEGKHLERAGKLMNFIKEDFWNEEGGELMDSAPSFTPAGIMPDSAEPASQAHGAEAMISFWAFGGGQEWNEMAERVLTGWKTRSEAYGILAAPLARAINFYANGPLLVKLYSTSAKEASQLLGAVLLSPLPRLVPVLRLQETAKPRAEICTMQACTMSSEDASSIAEELDVRHELFERGER
jgi:hypothetical protein